MPIRSADHDTCAALARFHLRPVSAACAALLFASGAAHSQQAPAPASAASAPAAGNDNYLAFGYQFS